MRFWFKIFAFLFFPLYSVAQSYNFKNYSVENGLPFIGVSAIFQDHDGFLWCGGYGGLSRFDGNAFTNFSPKNGLINNAVTAISEDHKGRLLIGTIGGISFFSQGKFQNISFKQKYPSSEITCLQIGPKDETWIGTKNGLAKINQGRIEDIRRDSLGKHKISALTWKNNELFIGTDKGLFSLDSKNILNPILLNNKKVMASCIQFDRDSLFVGTDHGIVIFYKGVFVRSLLEGQKINCLFLNHPGSLWIGLEKGLAHYYGQIKLYTIEDNENSNLVYSITSDKEQNLWIGTYRGIFRFRNEDLNTYSYKDGLGSNFSYQCLEDSKGIFYVTTKEGLFYKKSNHFFPSPVNNLFGQCTALLEFQPGKLMIGTDNGIFITNKKKINWLSASKGLLSNNIYTLYKDSKNGIWVGSQYGITYIKGDKLKSYRFLENDGFVSTIIEDEDGQIWAGAYQGGLYRLKNDQFEEVSREFNLKTDAFLSIEKDNHGHLFLGTFDGLYILFKNNSSALHIGKSEGLSSDLIYSNYYDPSTDKLWVGTNQGLNIITVQQYIKNINRKIDWISKEEGFYGVECNTNGIYKDKKGIYWFGTVNGLISYDPGKYIKNERPPDLHISRIIINNQEIDKNIGVVNYNENNITFYFTGISLSNPERVRYKIMLEGLEKDWSEPTSFNYIRYSKLPPGKYCFKVISSNSEGIWNKEPVRCYFEITPPFWRTTTFGIFSFAGLGFLAFAGIRFRLQQVRNNERRISSHRVELARMELKALRAQMNPHFIFNCLNSIQHFILKNDETSATKYLNKFSKLIRATLNNSEKQLISLQEEIDYLHLYLSLEELRFEDKFEWKITIDPKIDQMDIEIPPLLLQPYIENSIIHGLLPKKKEGYLNITLTQEGKFLKFIVEDNGVGRTATSNRKNKPYYSLGTKITQSRIDNLNKLYNLNIQSNIFDLNNSEGPCGTRVELIIPQTDDYKSINN